MDSVFIKVKICDLFKLFLIVDSLLQFLDSIMEQPYNLSTDKVTIRTVIFRFVIFIMI